VDKVVEEIDLKLELQDWEGGQGSSPAETINRYIEFW
jgi:hypothetical protein